MNKFRIEGTEVWFAYTEENHDRVVTKAKVLVEAHPNAKIIYNHDRPNSTNSVSSNGDTPVAPQPAVSKSTRKAKSSEETVQLPNLSGNVDESSSDADGL